MLKPGDHVDIIGRGITTKVLAVDPNTNTIILAYTKGIQPGDKLAISEWNGLDCHPE